MWRTIRCLIIVTAFLTVCLLVLRLVERSFWHTGSAMKEALSAITGRDTHIVEGRAEVIEKTDIAELALLELKMSTTRSIEKSEKFSGLPLGTKKLVVRGKFRVKAGYRLKNGASLSYEHDRPVARFPQSEILSVELLDFDTLTEESGWLNRVQPEDREQIVRELREQMKRDAVASGLPEMVDSTLRTRLGDLLGSDSVRIERPLPPLP